MDSLLELNEKVPFQRDTEWTKNCEEILEKSTKNPQDIDFKNIHKYFKKLRIVDKNVCIKISLYKTNRKVKSPALSGEVEKPSTSLSLLRYFAIFLRKILFPRKAVFHTKPRENNVYIPNHLFSLIHFFLRNIDTVISIFASTFVYWVN